jgi:hypothetical protein
MKLYEKIARTFGAYQNCIKSNNTDRQERHQETIEELVKEHMPSGSGFDNDTTFDFDSKAERLIFNTSFHHMDECGYYDGWTDHQVVITPSLQYGFYLKVTGRDKRQIKEYIAEMFDDVLNTDIATDL